VAGAGWLAGTAELAWARIAPGPRDATEVGRMLLTSPLLPPAATAHWLRGLWRHRSARPRTVPVRAVLFDRDGTLVHDVPYNHDPDLVRPVAGARTALDRLRAAGVKVGVVTNQSGLARSLLDQEQVAAVNARVEELLGPFDVWQMCPHGDADGCPCRKPAPGMVLDAARRLGVSPARITVVGDIGRDVEAAAAAGARGILVPTATTRPEEVRRAAVVAENLATAVDLLLAAPTEAGP
jgi:HAD superfamily hydrolase (TIGR01662 family)